ncbi:MAG TPA: rhomboid family intramembrane serine protease [Chryseosolibacter sp.]|nr:rhomboid family intramembrane serine protease [Chryseosolibacter sp.]
MLRLTPVVKNLIIINVLVYLFQMLAPDKNFGYCVGRDLGVDVITGYLSIWDPHTSCFKPYQLFTYMFVHSPSGFMHIFFNMLTLVFMGPMLENFWGQKKFLLFYIVCGIGAGIFSVVMSQFFDLGTFGIMMGASGAIYGLLMGFGMQFPNMEIQLLIPPIPIKAKYLVFLLGGMTFLMDRSGGVAHFAHLGGIIFAFIMIRLWKSQGGGYY